MITLIVAGIVGIAILAAAGAAYLALFSRLQAVEQRLAAIERAPSPSIPAISDRVPPLQGLRIALSIVQDHPQPIFANLLREQLLKEDVLEVTFLPPETPPADSPDIDIFIAGTLTCNAYAEVYYRATLTAFAGSEPVYTITESPPGGDRPGNLAIELVSRLGVELEKRITRSERRQALRELSLD